MVVQEPPKVLAFLPLFLVYLSRTRHEKQHRGEMLASSWVRSRALYDRMFLSRFEPLSAPKAVDKM